MSRVLYFAFVIRPARLAFVTVVAVVFISWLAPDTRAASPPPLKLFGTLPATEHVSLSPNGHMVAAITTSGDTRLLGVIDMDGRLLIKLNIGQTKVYDLQWAGDDYIVLHSYDTQASGRQKYNLLRANVISIATKTVTQLPRASNKYLQAIFGRYGYAQEDGVWYAYIGVLPIGLSRLTGDTYFIQAVANLTKVNLETGDMTTIAPGGGDGRRWVLDSTGAVIARSEYDDKSRQWTVFRGKENKSYISGQSDYGFEVRGQGRTAGTILVEEGGANGRLTELTLEGSAQEELLPGSTSLFHAPDTGLLIGALLPNGTWVIYDETLKKRMASVERAFKGATVTLVSVSADLSTVVVYIEDQDLAGTWQIVDFKTGKSSPFADKYPDIKSEMIGPTKVYNYKASDGLELDGILTLPQGRSEKGLPLVVLPHGGPEAEDKMGFDWWAQAFASRGYAVFQPNFRGSGGRGLAFRNAGFGEWGRKMQTDVSDGVSALAADGIVDPQRACIVGGSYGGYAALAGVTVQQGVYRCAASYSGVSDPEGMMHRNAVRSGNDQEGRRYWASYLGTTEHQQVPDDISPLKLAARADAPVLLIHGQDDTVVSISQSLDMESALRRAGKPVEFLRLNGEDHYLSKSETRLQMLEAMVSFVEKHNPPR